MYNGCMTSKPEVPHPALAEFFEPLAASWRAEGRSDADVAAAVGLDKSVLSRLIRGLTRIGATGPALGALCRELKLDAEQSRRLYEACGVDLAPVLGGESTLQAAGA